MCPPHRFRLYLKKTTPKKKTFVKFSINLDVFWRLQPFTVFGSLWEAATAANYLSVRALSCLWDGLVTNVRIVPRCHSFSCSSSVTRPCHYNPFSKEERMRGARERQSSGGWERQACRVTFVWVSGLLCAQGDNTSHCHYIGWHKHAHIHRAKTASGRHTIPFVKPHVDAEKYCFADVFSKIVPPYFFLLVGWQAVPHTKLVLLCAPLQRQKSEPIDNRVNLLNAIQVKSLTLDLMSGCLSPVFMHIWKHRHTQE